MVCSHSAILTIPPPPASHSLKCGASIRMQTFQIWDAHSGQSTTVALLLDPLLLRHPRVTAAYRVTGEVVAAAGEFTANESS